MTRHCILTTSLAVLVGFGGFGASAGAQQALTRKTLKAAIQSAKTPQDHQRIAAYYKNEATQMLDEAKEHEELAVVYAKSPRKEAPIQTAEHCKYFADAARRAAQASQELAKMHEEMAKQAL